ncbi:PsbP-related protein [Clostridium sp. MD294]|uniref:PsbP-related protein n=1 Tax=Clostridium sp. MD294 TaxID=97138 RepID=UPI0002C9D193|nr:PsbP-related protein [Clostridium sp. MD294]NDO47478.1 hypothetical protein [Clostridium sp. MD294]USF29451.1 hypothetical protein C820_000842 [Clostridium sp. MD294]
MNYIKKRILFMMIACVVIILVACHSAGEEIEYMDNNGNFSITLPSTWIQDTGVNNNDTLVLYSNEQRDIIVSIQRYDREVAEDTMGLNSLEKFQQFYKINSIVSTLYTQGEVKEIDYTMENMKNVIAQEVMSKSNDDTTAKAFCVIAENDNAYYTCAITGEQKVYHKNINHLKEVLSKLNEK